MATVVSSFRRSRNMHVTGTGEVDSLGLGPHSIFNLSKVVREMWNTECSKQQRGHVVQRQLERAVRDIIP